LNENRDFVSVEEMRLKNLGFDGDVIDKMFKAGRYYFREKGEDKSKSKSKSKSVKKNVKSDSGEGEEDGEEDGEEGQVNKKTTRNYISMNSKFIEAINIHLTKSMKEIDFKPQTSFIQFVEENKNILQVEVRRLYEIINNNSGDDKRDDDKRDDDKRGDDKRGNENIKNVVHKEITTKLKKTFKNRYFAMMSKVQIQI